MAIDLSTLNPPQRDAVLHGDAPLVVFAGAGSGKTRVITHRVANLVAERGIPPWRILAVTFTNKAAQEMRERLEHLVPGAARDLQVGTFHATCARLLRRYHDRIGLRRDFTIYDEADQRAMITRVLRDLKMDEKRFPPKSIAGRIERAKQEMVEPSEIDAGVVDTPHVRAIVTEYEKRMAAASALDFGDLIYRMVRALENDEVLRKELATRFQHILVDEFQDTNHSQLRMVLALASVHRALCVVGDDDQSIYRWRGADRRNILDFRRHFPDAHVVKLEQNYRSTKRILRASHAVISRAFDREPKELWTDNDEGAKVEVHRLNTEREEANLVVTTARALKNEGKSLADLAIFYRIHAQSRVLEEALRAASLPYRVVGGVRFYDRAEVKDLLAYLRVLSVPEDDVSLLRIINVPARGIGKTTIDRLLDRAAAAGNGVWEACKAQSEERGGNKLGDFVGLIESLRAKVADLDLPGLARTVLDETGYVQALQAENTPEADARLENLAELVGSMEQFVAEAEEPTLTAFLERVTLQTDAEGGDSKGENEIVTLMTVHAAKGLEFPVVIVAGMEEQLFPFRGLEQDADPEELEEERRLAYVAFTRARERLILSWASTRYFFGNLRDCTRSRFIDELPGSDVKFVGGTGDRPSFGRANAGWIEDRGSTRVERFDARPSRVLSTTAGPIEAKVTRKSGGQVSLRVGQSVKHVRYGQGKVVRFGTGDPPNVDVEFPGHGKKTIRADFLDPA
ncbi:ATP-dependent helicase [Sandaracinus amylolyticus]|uniref:DNA 3'-5' helicase n=1 Tax=Sandaracinus amylolyticus TaxID=927083 RepID=A0A0F6W1W5_9BACT|nr:UvrD-helicase domain-containing protein [Sandaracinus amylolyticus]AKF05317.1 ATP-dependent DNA helicase UvrD/PcrA [Sandaracinus amylolyticus]